LGRGKGLVFQGFAHLFAAKFCFAGLQNLLRGCAAACGRTEPAAIYLCVGGGGAAKLFIKLSEKHSFSANRAAAAAGRVSCVKNNLAS